MSFALVKPGGFAFGERLPSAAMNALDADHANAIDGVAGGTYTPSAPIIIGGSGLQIGTLSVTGNSTIGNATGDTLTVEATATINGPWTFASGSAPIFNDGPTFNNTATFNGGVILGNGASDAITVNGTLTVNNDATFGSSSGDTCTFNASVLFNGPINFGGDLIVNGAVELQNDCTFGTNASDLIDVLGRFRIRRKLEYQVDGRVPDRYAALADADTTLQASDGSVFLVPTGNAAARVYTLGTTDVTDGDWMEFSTASLGTPLANNVTINSPTASQDFTWNGGDSNCYALYRRMGGGWRLVFEHHI